MTIIVNVSGGLSSIEALERSIAVYGREGVQAVFADVGQVIENGRVVCGEDEDLLRFMGEAETFLKVKIQRIKHPKYSNIWDCFFGERFMGNTQVDVCSKFLKREVLIKWSAQFKDPVQVLGFSWQEMHRVERFRKRNPNAWFPLCEKPFLINEEIAAKWESRGIKRSSSYLEGFAHDNCGGMCVKMGLGQLYKLWRTRFWRFEYAERREKEFRQKINPNVTIFKKSGARVTMEALRVMFEGGFIPRTAPCGESCGGQCMLPDAAVEDLMNDPMF